MRLFPWTPLCDTQENIKQEYTQENKTLLCDTHENIKQL